MKILLGVPEYPPYHIGGGGEVYKNLAEQYKKLGHDVVVMYGFYPTGSWFENIKSYVDNNGIRFYQIPEIPYPKSLPFLRTVMPPNLRSYLSLKSIIQREGPDVAHIHGYGLSYINILARMLRNGDIKYIFTLHGYPESQNESIFLVRVIYLIYDKLFSQRALKLASGITGVSKYISENRILEKYREKTSTILNGIDAAEYVREKGAQNEDIFSELSLRQGKDIIFLSIGRLSRMKGFQDIIVLLRPLISAGLPAHYVIAGIDDGYASKLKQLVAEEGVQANVHFIGWKNRHQIISLLHQCDIFAIPSLWDPCPIVAFEGMACGKFIISSEQGGIGEILQDYPYKLSMKEADFKNKLLEVCKQKIYKKVGTTDLDHMSWKNIAAKYIRIAQEIIV